MGRQRPASVTNAIRAQWALVAVSGLTALLTLVQRDDLVIAWAEGSANARPILRSGGLAALEDAAIDIPAFGPLALVSFLVFAAMAAVLVAFFREGYNWARISLVAMAAFYVFAMLGVYRLDPPPLFLVAAVVSTLLGLLLIWLLVHRDTGAFIRGAGLVGHRDRES